MSHSSRKRIEIALANDLFYPRKIGMGERLGRIARPGGKGKGLILKSSPSKGKQEENPGGKGHYERKHLKARS